MRNGKSFLKFALSALPHLLKDGIFNPEMPDTSDCFSAPKAFARLEPWLYFTKFLNYFLK